MRMHVRVLVSQEADCEHFVGYPMGRKDSELARVFDGGVWVKSLREISKYRMGEMKHITSITNVLFKKNMKFL